MSRLDRSLRWSAGLNLLSAMAMVLFSQEFGLEVWGPVALGLGLGAFTGHRVWPRRRRILVTGGLVALFLLLLLLAFTSGNWLGYTVVFSLASAVTRTLQTTTARHYFQVAVLGFLVMVAGAVLNPDITFGIFFLPYGITLVWTLLLTHVRQLVEDAGGDPGVAWKASALVRTRLFTGTSALALILLVSSLALFLLFPRLGLGFFSAQTRRPTPVAGFSDSIRLGHFGNILDSGKVVLRVELPGGREVPDGTLRLTGITFETYTGLGWESRQERTWPLLPDQDGFFITWWDRVWRDPAEGVRTREYDIYQEPMATGSRVVFGMSHVAGIRPLEARLDRYRGLSKAFLADASWNLTWRGPEGAALAYTVRTVEPEESPDALRSPSGEDPEWIRAFNTALPANLDPRIGTLAREAAAGATTRYDRAVAVRDHLLREYAYSTEGGHDPRDPLADFLFGRRAGHCEYFSTAMAVMLRALDVPARSANGFLGGEYNDYGGYYMIKESDAHSWVEVFFPDYGWIPFDPTPPGRREEGLGLLGTMDLWFDTLRLQWFKWVVEFDLESQLRVYAGLWNAMAPDGMSFDSEKDLTPGRLRDLGKRVREGLLTSRNGGIALAVLLALAALAWGPLLLRRARGKIREDAGRRWERRVRRSLRRAGVEAPAVRTLPEVAARAAAAGHPAAPRVEELAVSLDRLRWSPAPDVEAEVSRIRALLRHLPRRRSAAGGDDVQLSS